MSSKSIFGLDISDHSVEALQLRKAFFSRPKVRSYARAILRGEIIRNGVIKKPDNLAASIRDMLKAAQPSPITSRYCIVSLPESQVFTTIIKFPAGLKHREIRNTIPYKAEELIPFKSSDIYFDFKTITISRGTQEVFYAAVPAKIVDSYVDVLRRAGLEPLAIDIESISLARSLLAAGRVMNAPIVLMDIGSRITDIHLFDRNGMRESISSKIAGARFTKAVSVALGLPEKQATALKIKNGLDPKKQDAKALAALQGEVKKIIDQTKKIIDYYQKKSKRAVDEVILAGGSALLPKIDEYLKSSLGVNVGVGNPFVNIIGSGNLSALKGKAILFANVCGLALRGVAERPIDGDINLLPIATQSFVIAPPRHERKSWMKVYIRLVVLVVLINVLIGLLLYRQGGHDPYWAIIGSPQFQTNMDSQVNQQLLDELRFNILNPSTTTPTTTAPLFSIKIKPTPVGFLNVRSQATATSTIVGRAPSGSAYPVTEQQPNWFKIKFQPADGWVDSRYVDKLP